MLLPTSGGEDDDYDDISGEVALCHLFEMMLTLAGGHRRRH